MQVMSTADVGDLNLFRRGKVRDTFQLADGTLLMIATDRLSVFDVVLPTPIPGKGAILTQMSRWWFDQTAAIMPNHLLTDMEEAIPEAVRSDWLPRSMHVARAQRIDVECVVRGFISGSGWKEYREKGTRGYAIPRASRRRASRPRSRRTTATTSTSRVSSSAAWWVNPSPTSWSRHRCGSSITRPRAARAWASTSPTPSSSSVSSTGN
jgi:phosphoribosylaminoimidazole-succinocarboxamide synthase